MFRRAGLLTGRCDLHDAAPARSVDRAAVTARLERLARVPRPADGVALEALISDAAAVVLVLERERLVAKRRRKAAMLDAGQELAALQEAAGFAGQEQRAQDQIDELRALMAAARGRPRLAS